MAKELEEGADLSEYLVLKCSAGGELFGSRMMEVERVEDGKVKKIAVQVADTPPKPADEEDEEGFGHYADWWQKYVKKDARVLSSMAIRSGKAVADHDETRWLVFSERGQSQRIGFRKYGWYKKVFLESDGSVMAQPQLTGDNTKDVPILAAFAAKCTVKNLAFMNMYTMEIEHEIGWEDVKVAAAKGGTIWYMDEKEAEYVNFYIRCETFKIYAKEWTNWVRSYNLKAVELGMTVSINC